MDANLITATSPTLLPLTVSPLVGSDAPNLATVVPKITKMTDRSSEGGQNVSLGKICGSRLHLLPLLLALAPPPTSVQLSPSLARRFRLNIDSYFRSTSGGKDSFIKLL